MTTMDERLLQTLAGKAAAFTPAQIAQIRHIAQEVFAQSTRDVAQLGALRR